MRLFYGSDGPLSPHSAYGYPRSEAHYADDSSNRTQENGTVSQDGRTSVEKRLHGEMDEQRSARQDSA